MTIKQSALNSSTEIVTQDPVIRKEDLKDPVRISIVSN